MRLFLACILYFYTISQGSGYIFPICNTKDDKSCTQFFTFPSLNFPSLSYFSNEEPKLEEKTLFVDALKVFINFLNPYNIFYEDSYETKLSYIYKNYFADFSSIISDQFIFILSYVPYLGFQQKSKANTRLYLLFIICSLGIYLVLYFYFASKLYYFYQRRLRRQYLDKVKKILKPKE